MIPLSNLLTPLTRDEWRDALLTFLGRQGLPVTDWHSGGVELTNVYMMAQALTDLDARAIPAIAASGFIDLAQGQWLDYLAYSQYDELRKPSVFAVIPVVLTAQAGRGPYELRPGDIRAATDSGLKWQSVDGGVIPAGGSLTINMRAESPGAAYNIPAGALTRLLTPYPGVTMTNPGTFTQAGVDAEPDEVFRNRLKLKWASIGYGASSDAYRYWALTARAAVTQVRVLDQHPRGQGTVDVIIWGQGGLSPDDVAYVAAVIDAKRSNTANVLTYSATPRVVNITGTAYTTAATLGSAPAAALANITQLQGKTDIGGVVYHSAIVEALMLPPGVRNVELTNPVTDLQLGPTEAVVFNVTGLNWVAI